jgi:chromosome partitioning protein
VNFASGGTVKRLKWARVFAGIASILVIATISGSLYYYDIAIEFVEKNQKLFRLVGLGIGPFLAVMGFIWGLVDKVELKVLAQRLGNAQADAKRAQEEADRARARVDAKAARIKALEHNLKSIAGTGKLWTLRKNMPFSEYRGWKYDPEGAKVVTIALFKGGVGKSHLAANFAAYVSEKQMKPVLLIDLDYQGSLSTSVLRAAAIEPVGSHVDALFDETADLESLARRRIHLAGGGADTVLNHGQGLSRAWLVPADYTLAEVESQLLVDRVINNSAALDERYRLAHLLLHPSVRRDYAMIIIDTPPRMTLGTVNALVASHSYVVPVILDRIASEAVKPFLSQVKALKKDLEIDLSPAGIVGTLTRTATLSPREQTNKDQIEAIAREVLGDGREYFTAQHIPIRAEIQNQDDLGYFLSDANGPLRVNFYDPIFDELWNRIMSLPNQIS